MADLRWREAESWLVSVRRLTGARRGGESRGWCHRARRFVIGSLTDGEVSFRSRYGV